MNQHEQITRDLDALIEERRDLDIMAPGSLALALLHRYAPAPLPPQIAYTSLQHLKQLARERLTRRFGTKGEESEAYDDAQGKLFSGRLQARYPIPHKRGEEPVYKLRENLTAEERAWNVAALRKSATGLLAHADALEAETFKDHRAA